MVTDRSKMAGAWNHRLETNMPHDYSFSTKGQPSIAAVMPPEPVRYELYNGIPAHDGLGPQGLGYRPPVMGIGGSRVNMVNSMTTGVPAFGLGQPVPSLLNSSGRSQPFAPAAGGGGGTPPVNNRDEYKEALRQQIEEKKRMDAIAKVRRFLMDTVHDHTGA
ncbi:unnamed protein product [Sphagnum balticum]